MIRAFSTCRRFFYSRASLVSFSKPGRRVLCRAMIALDQLTCAQCEPCIGQPFTCSVPAFSLTLEDAVVLGAARPGVERSPFSLRFHGAPTLRLSQQIYRLENARLGSLEIFIVQTGADAQASHFEAIFN